MLQETIASFAVALPVPTITQEHFDLMPTYEYQVVIEIKGKPFVLLTTENANDALPFFELLQYPIKWLYSRNSCCQEWKILNMVR